jgi:hypothetical protein
MANAVPNSGRRGNEIVSAVVLANRLALVFIAIAAGGLAFSGRAIFGPGVSLFAIGVGSYAVLLLSWHYYRPRVSVYAWLLFSVAMVIAAVGGILLPVVREGSLHPLGALSVMSGWFGAGVAVPLVLSAAKLRRWASE